MKLPNVVRNRSAAAIVGALAVMTLGFAGCKTTTEGAQPDDMSAKAHRAHAAEEKAKAEKHKAQYDPNAEQLDVASRRGDGEFDEGLYNPTEHHLGTAGTHEAHAKAHLAAAAALESFEQAECGKFPAKTRKLCPLLGTVEKAEQIDAGVRITVASGVNMDALVAHLRCHFAFGRTRGYEGMDSCPLYLKGVAIEKSGDREVLLKSDDPQTAKSLYERTKTHVSD